MFNIYPEGVGEIVHPQIFARHKIHDLQKKLPTNLVIRLFGLKGIGKESAALAISKLLEVLLVSREELEFILNFILIKYFTNRIPVDIRQVISPFGLVINTQNKIELTWKGNKINLVEAKTIKFHAKLTSNVLNPKFVALVDSLIGYIVVSVEEAVIITDYAARPQSVELMLSEHKDIIQILLTSNLQETFKRYYLAKLSIIQKHNFDYEPDNEFKNKVLADFEYNILDFNTKLIELIKRQKIGLITQDTLLVQNTGIDLDLLIGSVLKGIDYCLE